LLWQPLHVPFDAAQLLQFATELDAQQYDDRHGPE